ncbi:alpha-L-rhamnosidase-related protein [Saccharibacillus kuerlensis]|uniref:Alpha-L-rhamnosidase n=1 Tax=Saccharibacillus kuerlensis TaxID=459527 RepID=A0ABQ2L3W7_9BACL|nr:family 78 glycoside hydrolase catalytic domain [Saccharibacillus kuerlensis]GGO01771.1 alpha-L-rhamnosidase [Saccharibacillus kuerlensis]
MNIQRSEEQVIQVNESFARKAETLMPELFYQDIEPYRIVEAVEDPSAIHGWSMKDAGSAEELSGIVLGKGDSVILDFGDHRVGTIRFDVSPVGSPPDAPLYMKVIFAEMPVETAVPFSEYEGWISRSWLQEEHLHVDILPASVEMERRYSFRYVKLEVLDTSVKYKVSFTKAIVRTVTSADTSAAKPLQHSDPELVALDRVAMKTLEDCMQEVFEDGPKRDRRLWLGDLRLQALTNYYSFGSNDLVKRCLYLFAAYPNDKGMVSANLFIKPKVIPDDTYLFDYSLFFLSTLHDYYEATGDRNTLKELWPTAYRQVELALESVDERGVVQDLNSWWSFIDWHSELNKQAPSQGILIYALKQAERLASELETGQSQELAERIHQLEEAAIEQLWDEKQQYFVSGEQRQVSWASQVWMVLAGVLEPERSSELLNRMLDEKPGILPNTPYMMHHLIEALILAGNTERAVLEMKRYWGGMLGHGADTFWELYNPEDLSFSPYGSHLINSYCHAWSCTPTYLIRKYGL